MHDLIEKLAHKVAEGFQSTRLASDVEKVNIFHRKVTVHESADLSFITGLASTGLRGIVILDAKKLLSNYEQINTVTREHIPLVINVSALSKGMEVLQSTGCFQFVASSAQEHIYLSLLAQRISELSLVPGMVVANYIDTAESANLPSDELIKKYLGNSDDQIECPTPAQKIIFGNTRRRVPNWFSMDLPVMLGAEKEGTASAFEAMATEKYFLEHLPALIEQAQNEFKATFDIDIELVATFGKNSDTILITYDGAIASLYQNNADKKLPQLKVVKQISPLPVNELDSDLGKLKGLTVLEKSDFGGSKSSFYQGIKSLASAQAVVYSARYESIFSSPSLVEIVERMNRHEPPFAYFIELPFTKQKSEYPKHEILLQEIIKQYPDLINLGLGNKTSNSSGNEDAATNIPLTVRKHNDIGPNYSKLSRFYDDTAFFFQHNEVEELVADPFASLPISPAGSAGFFNQNTNREQLPVFRPTKCTGCGDCLIHCPHAAIPALAIGVEQLMKAGMDIANSNGHRITKLTPMLKNLAKLAGKSITDKKVTGLIDFLPETFENLATQMKLEDEALELAQSEFNIVLNELKSIPIAITEQFYTQPNTEDKGSGELFSLIVNPASCTGCNICAEVCEEDAWGMAPVDNELEESATRLYNLWESLPDTSISTITKLTESNDYSSLAAVMLSRENYLSVSGGSKSEDNNPYKTLLHLTTAITTSLVRPKINAQLTSIKELINTISDSIHGNLSTALPKENLDALSRTLKENRSGKATFQEIVDKINEFEHGKLIDTQALRRKTELVDALKELKWVLSEGPSGIGRANFGLVLAGEESISWARSYPYNNMNCPTVVEWQSGAPEQTLGIINGHLRHVIDNIKLIRRAELEAANKYDPLAHDIEIASLDWAKLTADEKALIPPILLVGERADLNRSGWQSLNKILASDYPIKVILFDHIAPAKNNAVADYIQSSAGIITALALKKAFVFQGSIADEEHLANGLLNGMAAPYPALINLFVYKQELYRHESEHWKPFAQLATNSRSFPHIYFNPDKDHGFLNGAIDLDSNPSNKEDWVEEEIKLPNGETLNYKITWADWAFTQSDWETEFKKIPRDTNNKVVAEYLKLKGKDRANNVPVIIRSSSNGLVHFSVSKRIIAMADTVLANWNTLQELAGLITEFPVKLSEEVKKELTKKFDQDAEALKKEYEEKLKEQQDVQTEAIRQQIKEKLITLAKMAKN